MAKKQIDKEVSAFFSALGKLGGKKSWEVRKEKMIKEIKGRTKKTRK